LDHLKNQAKALRKAHQQRDPDVCTVLRHLRRFQDAGDEEILSADVPLTEVQFALAMEYGFGSWQELRKTAVGLKPPLGYDPKVHGDAMILPNPPPGVGPSNRLVAALGMALGYVGAPTDYETVSGDLGTAFIFQADARHKPYDANVKVLDMGWWPLAPWGVRLRLDFVSAVSGVPMRELPTALDEYRADPALHYRKYHEADVIGSLRAGRPVAVVEGSTRVVFGWDGGNPPLLGQLVCTNEASIDRVEKFPWVVIVFGEPGEPMDRRQADAEALDYAIRLGRDEVDLSDLPGKSSGRRSWELWAEQLANEELCGPSFYHANVVGNLKLNRQAAGAYLRTMSARYERPVNGFLLRAAAEFDAVLAKLRAADVSKDALGAAEGRQQLVSLIREMVDLEARAQDRMGEAHKAM